MPFLSRDSIALYLIAATAVIVVTLADFDLDAIFAMLLARL